MGIATSSAFKTASGEASCTVIGAGDRNEAIRNNTPKPARTAETIRRRRDKV